LYFGSHLREIPLTRCSVFKDQCLIFLHRRLSAATFIIYHSDQAFGKYFFEKSVFHFSSPLATLHYIEKEREI
ncbi:hypothetical protein, partial [Paenibacillus sp. sgz5001063]|uniref:hypothetical protein n=1 Tax=Paenibacillus sp. sgz5001063 TaxID=3242474 RepID=UPI0036D3DDB9